MSDQHSEGISGWDSPRLLEALDALIDLALDEDRVNSDAATLPLFEDDRGTGRAAFIAKSPLVVCGFPIVQRVYARLDPNATVVEQTDEGVAVPVGHVGCVVQGSISSLLSGERIALNFVQHLSGVATRARAWSRAAGPGVAVLDTRKTRPGWRLLEKLAVRTGGGVNHRGDLAEFPMIKDNHRELFRHGRSMTDTDDEIRQLRDRLNAHPASRGKPVEIEVEDFDSFEACVLQGIDFVLIDNQSPETIQNWMSRLEEKHGAALQAGWQQRLEASGGITLETIREYAAVGVGRISVGALTHSVVAADWSVRIEREDTR